MIVIYIPTEGRGGPVGKRWTVALALVWVVVVAGCGQPPPSSGQGAGKETTAETTAETTTVDVGGSPELEAAADEYEEYVAEQAALLADLTEGFANAVIAGDVERARELYAPARVPWERIEPIAAQLGDYDPNIDAREGDVPDEEWRGFHRIEKALWVEDTTEGQARYARRLMEDVSNLREDVEGLELEPVDLVTGSVELLNEVTGGFDDVYEELDQYRKGDGWVSYETLHEADRRALSQKVDALAEPLSRVGQVLEG